MFIAKIYFMNIDTLFKAKISTNDVSITTITLGLPSILRFLESFIFICNVERINGNIMGITIFNCLTNYEVIDL